MKWSSLRVQFSLAVMSLIVVMVGVLSFALTVQIERPIEEATEKKGEARIHNLAANAREGLLTEDELMVASLLDQLKRDASVVSAAILDVKGRVLAHSDPAVKKNATWHPVDANGATSRVLVRNIEVRGKPIARAMLEMSRRDGQNMVANVQHTVWIMAWFMVAVGIVVSLWMVNYVTRPLKILTKGVETVGAGNWDHQIEVKSAGEIGELAGAFNAMTVKLRQAQQDLLDQDRMRQELRIAKEIQEALLPKEFPKVPGLDIGAVYQSAKEVGGDYYDFFWVDHRRLGVVMADVSGKGVPGALGMMVTRNILRTKAIGKGWPSHVLSQTNLGLRNNMKRGMFVTAFYALLDVQEKILTCSNAGHHPMLVFRKGGGYEVVDPPGIALGLGDAREFEHAMTDITVQLFDGDFFLLYSDGVPEAVNAAGEEFGERRLIEAVERASELESQAVVDALKREWEAFTKGCSQHDDMTVVVVRMAAV